MKKIFLLVISIILVGFMGTSLAQRPQEPITPAQEALPELPNPGILPDSFWYFLDRWGEGIHEFFIFISC